MRNVIAAGIVAVCFVPVAAQAQDASTQPTGTAPYADPSAPAPAAAPAPYNDGSTNVAPANTAGTFAGFRLEGNIGWDKQQAYGNNNEKFGYGGSAGFDGNLTDRIVVGPEVNYWRPNNGRNTVYSDDRVVAKQGGEIWGAAVRVGFRATPDLIVFGKGGFAQQRQRTYYVDAAGAAARSTGRTDGYQVGGGFQYAPSDRFSFVPANVYVSGQYVYSNFSNHTSDQHAMAGVGIRFR